MRLAAKLLQIRQALDLSQTELLERLGLADKYAYTIMSRNERGTREPTLLELLAYARLANIYLEVLVDDLLDLPPRLPSPEKSAGVKRKK